MPSLLISVSLSAASTSPGEREAVLDVAPRYTVVVRWFIWRIAAREGGPTGVASRGLLRRQA